MIPESERKQIIALVKREVVPAIGCTEPIAVALCVAKATEVLGYTPERITAYLSANILKNAMGVGIPGTGMIGLPIAIALGALIGKSAYQLEVLKDCTPEAVEAGKVFIAQKRIQIELKEHITEKLYIEIKCEAQGRQSTAIISGGHTTFVYIADGQDVLLNKQNDTLTEETEECADLHLRKVFDFATTAPLEEIKFILDTARLNKAAAEQSFEGEYGHGLGKVLRGRYEAEIMGDSTFSHILALHIRRMRRSHGRCHDTRDEQFGQRKPRHFGHHARSDIRPRQPEERRRTGTCPDAKPPHGDIHQAEPRQIVSPLRLCCSGHGQQLRHHMAHGRRLQASELCRAEHDSQHHRHDMRWSQAQLRLESNHRSINGSTECYHGHGRQARHLGRRNH